MIEHHIASINSGEATSTEIPANGLLLTGIFFPPVFTGASISFHAAIRSGGPFYPMNDGTGVTLSKTIQAGTYLPLDPALFAGVSFLRIISASNEAATRQLLISTRVMQ